MAITILTPGAIPFEDLRKRFNAKRDWQLKSQILAIAEKTRPTEDVESGHGRILAVILTSLFVASRVVLLIINTALTQDAFVLEKLKLQNNIVKDQRDAILREAAAKSSPAYVASRAIKLGMVPSVDPQFIALDGAAI